MANVTQAQKRSLGAAFWLLVLFGLGRAVNGGAGGGGGAPPVMPPAAPLPPQPAPGPAPTLPPGIPGGSTFDPPSNSFTDPTGNIWTQNADGSWSLSPIPAGASFNPVSNTWTDPTGTVWTQNIDGSWMSGTAPPGSRLHMFPVGSRVNLNAPEGVFPATVTRHEGHTAAGEPLYGLTLDLNNTNATAIPESFLTPGAPAPGPTPPPVDREFRNLTFAFSAVSILANQPGVVRLTVAGEYKGPQTSVQARLGADNPRFQGIEAVSVEALLPDSGDFFPFGPLQTGNLRWPAFTFDAGQAFQLLGRLVETDGIGTILRVAGSATGQMNITQSGVCALENNRAEILVQDDTGAHPLVQIGDQDHAEISTRSTPFVLTWPVRNQGTGPQSVRLETLCGFITINAARIPTFNLLDTIIGPSFLVEPGQQVLLSMTVLLANFPRCDGAGQYTLRMVGSDPSCGPQVGNQTSFKVRFSTPALSLASMGGFP